MPQRDQFRPGPPIGSKFGKLIVIESNIPIQDGNQRTLASKCQCECGNVIVMRNYVLRRPRTRSCGCTRKHGAARRGANQMRTYALWRNMITRCRREPRYANVSICEAWATSFENFLADMGECPEGLSLDRINNNGNYEPGNCRWADATTQNNNKRSNRKITFNGETKTVQEWMRYHGLDSTTFYRRLKLGWTEEMAAATPKRGKTA